MTSLHYTLIALGIALVGAVMLYNLWQERRSRRQAERIFQPREDAAEVSLGDLTLPDELPETRIEPRIRLVDDEEAAAPVQYEPAVAPAAPEPAAAPLAEHEPAIQTARPEPAMAPESPLDGEIEYVARLRYAQPAAIPFAALQDTLRRISKPIRMVGRRDGGAWEEVAGHAAKPYDTVELALLLADRSGPVSEVQLEAFCRRLYEFASEHGGAVSCQDQAEAVERARALDAFCAEVDMLIGLNVIPPTGAGFDSQVVFDLAAAAGLSQGADGAYSLRGPDGQVLFTLTDGMPGEPDTGHGVTLLFDVPRVARGLEAFDRMTHLGLALAERLGGHLVDDGGRPVSRASLERDRKSLETLYARMAARGIPAGGERALRLFA